MNVDDLGGLEDLLLSTASGKNAQTQQAEAYSYEDYLKYYGVTDDEDE